MCKVKRQKEMIIKKILQFKPCSDPMAKAAGNRVETWWLRATRVCEQQRNSDDSE